MLAGFGGWEKGGHWEMVCCSSGIVSENWIWETTITVNVFRQVALSSGRCDLSLYRGCLPKFGDEIQQRRD